MSPTLTPLDRRPDLGELLLVVGILAALLPIALLPVVSRPRSARQSINPARERRSPPPLPCPGAGLDVVGLRTEAVLAVAERVDARRRRVKDTSRRPLSSPLLQRKAYP